MAAAGSVVGWLGMAGTIMAGWGSVVGWLGMAGTIMAAAGPVVGWLGMAGTIMAAAGPVGYMARASAMSAWRRASTFPSVRASMAAVIPAVSCGVISAGSWGSSM